MHHSTIVDKSVHGCRNWYFLVRQNLDTLQCNHFSRLDISIPKSTLWRCVYNKMMDNFKQEWNVAVTQPNSRNGQGRNKLRTYSQFKTEFRAEAYCKVILHLSHRSALSKVRWGVAPIRIETGRYENLPLNERECYFCDSVEDEVHVLLDCSAYTEMRANLLSLSREKVPGFDNYSNKLNCIPCSSVFGSSISQNLF